MQVVEDGYEFFAKRQLVTVFSAPNYCGEFDNAGAMMSVDEELMCSFQVGNHAAHSLAPPPPPVCTQPPSRQALPQACGTGIHAPMRTHGVSARASAQVSPLC
jgi:hypothetical protein